MDDDKPNIAEAFLLKGKFHNTFELTNALREAKRLPSVLPPDRKWWTLPDHDDCESLVENKSEIETETDFRRAD